jgi:nitrogen-specific signal transduction histidine kinase
MANLVIEVGHYRIWWKLAAVTSAAKKSIDQHQEPCLTLFFRPTDGKSLCAGGTARRTRIVIPAGCQQARALEQCVHTDWFPWRCSDWMTNRAETESGGNTRMTERSTLEHAGTGAGRATVLRQQEELLTSQELTRMLLNAVPTPVLVINSAWQVVYANAAVLKMLAPSSPTAVQGLRAGEEFHCIHGRSGRGTSPSPTCRVCGVAQVVAAALDGRGTVSDCRLTCDLSGEAASLDLRAWATPLAVGGDILSILVLADISHEKRRAVLENVCFHDLLNTLTGIRGLLDVLGSAAVQECPEICATLDRMTERSIEEISSLRLLAQAEESTLKVLREELQTGAFLHDIVQTLRCHPAARGKELVLDAATADALLCSDRRLLRRVVENMALNALEASSEGGTVTVGCRQTAAGIDYWVHNSTWMPGDVQLQVFQRSFSTKGDGRGIGTYSIRLLSSLLMGTVDFSSTPELGTTFHATFPLRSAP